MTKTSELSAEPNVGQEVMSNSPLLYKSIPSKSPTLKWVVVSTEKLDIFSLWLSQGDHTSWAWSNSL